tara:strand:+ start:2039 stop:2254 length:216 start_codon:yes stop_codon:yes gene_type:complete
MGVVTVAKKRSNLDWVALVLVLLGAINWGLVGAFDFNLISTIFGGWAWLLTLVYILMGVSALYMTWQVSKE